MAKLDAEGAVNNETKVAPKELSGCALWINWPTRAGSERKAVAKITGITPAAISLIGKMDLIPP